MKIGFVTGSLVPGRDGVGDHVRMLAAECVRRGHEVALVALAEPEPIEAADAAWPVLRLSAVETRADGGLRARAWLAEFAPEWTSLHFVPYAFQPRGLFAPVIPALAAVCGTARRRQIFFHETWIGMGAGARWRQRVIGWAQRRAVAELLRLVQPEIVHTSIGYYRAALATLGHAAQVRPMFGNVGAPVAPRGATALPGVPAGALVAGMFGTVHPDWDSEIFLGEFAAFAAAHVRPAALVSVGVQRAGAGPFARVAAQARGRVACVALGEQVPDELARTFAGFDFAVSSTPWAMIGKSGSAAALREHGLRVVVTHAGAPPRFRCHAEELEPADDGLVPFFRDRTALGRALERTLPRAGVREFAAQFLASLADPQGPS
jgi:hypothetical protein